MERIVIHIFLGDNMKKEKKTKRIDYCKLQLGPRQKLFVHIYPLFSACICETAYLRKTYVLAAKLAEVKL